MRYLFIALIILVFSIGCNQTKRDDSTDSKAVSGTARKTTQKDSIEKVGSVVLSALKRKDYKTLASYFHPVDGVRFSPYGFIDPTHKQTLAKDFLEAIDKNWTLTWGHYDGSGDAIKLKVKPYIERYIYNADYLNADEKSYDNIIGKGNSINNLEEAYPSLHFTEYYFKGTEEKYKGLDWKSLRFVFKKHENGYFLVAIIHDQWTI